MNHLKRTFSIIIASLIIISCKSQDSGITFTKIESELPVKVLVAKSYPDSTLVTIMIPQEINIINNFDNKIDLSNISLSQDGSDVIDYRIGLIQELKNNSLQSVSSNLTLSKGSEMQFQLYACYFSYLRDDEKEKVIENGKFAQFLFKDKKEVFNVSFNSIEQDLLLNKIEIGKRGFIHFNLYNPKTKNFFSENLKIKF